MFPAGKNFDEGPLKSRWFKQCFCTELCFPLNCLLSPLRHLVSKKKRRYIKDGYDLDLTYVTDRIIVHGFPAAGVEHLYRNPRKEVARFLEEKHAGKYKVFNFCCEPGRGYSADVFDGRVERYPFRDHGVPPVETLSEFCNSAKAWLDADPENVVSLHCKAGKGRAGIMTCCLLIRTGFKQSSTEALDYYDQTRVKNNKGLTVKSQRKFVRIYERLWRERWEVSGDIGKSPAEAPVGSRYPRVVGRSRRLTSVELVELPECLKGKDFWVTVLEGTTPSNFENDTIAKSRVVKNMQGGGRDSEVFEIDCEIVNNFCIQVFTKKEGLMGGKLRVTEMWHNTTMMGGDESTMEFGVEELNVKKKYRGVWAPLKMRLGFDEARKELGWAGGGGRSESGGVEMQDIVLRRGESEANL